MSPQSVAPAQSPSEIYEWVHIDDFSPGVYDGSHISTEQPIISAPLGAANAVGTFACASIPGGALGPLPAVVATTPFSDLEGGIPSLCPYAVITGYIITPQLNDGSFELVILFEADNCTDHYVRAYSVSSGGPVNPITGPYETTATAAGFFGSPYPAFSRMTASGSGNPPPILAFPTAVSTDSAGASGHLWVYPSLAAPTTFVADDLITAHSSTTGQLIAYASRLICLAGIDYSWPLGSGVNTNENINYTNPPLSSTYGNQETFLGAEIPWGYGAWGSVSLGELLLIKKYGGAVILNGDIDAPSSVIPVPGVESTGDFVGSAAATPAGLFYCSQNRGAWLWNGGNTSQKISGNIADDFFDLQTHAITSNNYGFFCYHWQKWVLFSKNLMYDTTSGAWWVLYPNSGVSAGSLVGQDLFWYSLTQNGNAISAAPLKVTSNSDSFATIFDNTVPSRTYQWTSLPIHVVKNADRVLDVRQIVVRASDPTGGAAAITVSIGSFSATTTATIGSAPTPIRLNVGAGAQGLDDIVVTVLAENTSSHGAPILHSIDIGYQVRAKVGVND
jgi:hypothetical protein